MAERDERGLTLEELEEQEGEELPDREVMSTISVNPGADGFATIAPTEPAEGA